MNGLVRIASLMLFCLSFTSLGLSGLLAKEPSTRTFPIGTFTGQGKLQNDAESALRLQVSSFAAYFLKEQDINLGFSIGERRKQDQQFAWSLDIAPHRIGPGVTWSPTRGKLKYLSYLGAGLGLNYTYNTSEKAWGIGIKGTLIRW